MPSHRIAAMVTGFMRRCGMRPLSAVTILFALWVAPAAAQTGTVQAEPSVIFAGHSTGQGELQMLFARPRRFHVESEGQQQADGSFRLDQRVSFEGEAPRTRHWIIRAKGDGSFVFTLSDAAGPGTAVVEGRRLRLRYPVNRGGVTIRQVLDTAADGRSITNRGSIRWLGIPIGRLSEKIVRAP